MQTRKLFVRRLRASLCRRANLLLAFVVGTGINLYGQLLVPWLAGEERPLAAWLARSHRIPAVVALTTALGYLFPLIVSVVSAAIAQTSPSSET